MTTGWDCAASARGKHPPSAQGDLQRGEVLRRDRVVRNGNVPRICGQRRPSLDVDAGRGRQARQEQGRPRGGRLDAGQRLQTFDQLLVEARDAGRFSIGRGRQLKAQRQHASGGKTRILAVQRDETADQQAGADEQHERNGQLADGKRRTHAAAAAAVSPRASAFLQVPTRVAS